MWINNIVSACKTYFLNSKNKLTLKELLRLWEQTVEKTNLVGNAISEKWLECNTLTPLIRIYEKNGRDAQYLHNSNLQQLLYEQLKIRFEPDNLSSLSFTHSNTTYEKVMLDHSQCVGENITLVDLFCWQEDSIRWVYKWRKHKKIKNYIGVDVGILHSENNYKEVAENFFNDPNNPKYAHLW